MSTILICLNVLRLPPSFQQTYSGNEGQHEEHKTEPDLQLSEWRVVAFKLKYNEYVLLISQWCHMSDMASQITGNLTFVQQCLANNNKDI